MKRVSNFLAAVLPEQSLEHLQALRNAEFQVVLPLVGEEQDILEIGAGTGWQALEFSAAGHRVSAIDLACPTTAGGGEEYSRNRVWPVIEYDGAHIPFNDHSFDVVFSSNVLEHIPDVRAFQAEVQRVLRPNGIAVHVVPSGTWRFWSCLTFYGRRLDWVRFRRPRTWVPFRHGEQGSAFSEIYRFSRFAWSRLFRETGWVVELYRTNRLFYTGYSICDQHLMLPLRRALSFVLGSSCHVFVLRGQSTSPHVNGQQVRSAAPHS